MAADEEREAAERLEALRRGLYGPHATGDDVERFVALRGAPGVTEAAPPPARSRRRGIAIAAGGAVVVAVLAVAALQTAGPQDVRAAGPALQTARSQHGRTTASPSDQVLTPYGATVPLPTPVPVVAEGEAAAGQRYRGTGNARFPVETAAAPARRGRMVVAVTARGRSPVRWRSVAVDPDASPAEHVFASGPSATARGGPVVAVLPYADGPPALLEIAAPGITGWVADVEVTLPGYGRAVLDIAFPDARVVIENQGSTPIGGGPTTVTSARSSATRRARTP